MKKYLKKRVCLSGFLTPTIACLGFEKSMQIFYEKLKISQNRNLRPLIDVSNFNMLAVSKQ